MDDMKVLVWTMLVQLVFLLQLAVVAAIVKWIWTMEYYQ